MKDDPKWLRQEGQRLVAKGQALLDRADYVETAIALGEVPAPRVGASGARSGLTSTARDMAEEGWVSAQSLAERTGADVRSAASCLSRLAANGELETRKQPGYPAEYCMKETDHG